MNWFVHEYPTDATKRSVVANAVDGACEHCCKNSSLAFIVIKEMDSFGPVSEFVQCKACYAKSKRKEAHETTICMDCKLSVRKSETRIWRWCGFYAPQGDEPWVICKTCWELEAHQDRIARDLRERERENE